MKKMRYTVTFLTTMVLTTVPAWANAILDSAPVQGALALVSDVTEAATYIAPLLTIGYLTICFARRGMAPLEERSNWNKTIKDSIFWGTCATVASAVVTTVTGYIAGGLSDGWHIV